MEMKFYHRTSLARAEKIRSCGYIYSEKLAIQKGYIAPDEITDNSTGEIDREFARDNYVFLSHNNQNYGEAVFCFSEKILSLPDCYVATAGDFLHFCDTPENLSYFKNSIIPGNQFIKYVDKFFKTLPNPDWFFGEKVGLKDFLSTAIKEKINGNDLGWKLYMKLFPEIIIKDKLLIGHYICP